MRRLSLQPAAIIVAVDELGGFARDKKIPWNYPEDNKFFNETTKGHPCVMGRYTYEEMLQVYKKKNNSEDDSQIETVLPERDCFVVTSDQNYNAPGATVVPSLYGAVRSLERDDNRTIFVLGGYHLFVQALPLVDTIYMTVIHKEYKCDRHFPLQYLNDNFRIVDGKQRKRVTFVTYKSNNTK